MGGGLDGACAKPTGGVAVDEQGQHHGRRILLAAGATGVDVEVVQGELLHGVQDEMDDMIAGQPFAQIAGQQLNRRWRRKVESNLNGPASRW